MEERKGRKRGRGVIRSWSCLRHGPSDYERISLASMTGGKWEADALMRVHDSREIDLAGVNVFFQHRCYSNKPSLLSAPIVESRWTLRCTAHSGGFAGSIMTASFDLSSTTR